MEFHTTFIKSDRPLVKRITNSGIHAAPLVKLISSEKHTLPCTAEGIRSKYGLMVEHAKAGNALYKGHFTRELVSESRKGLTQMGRTYNIVFDFDNVVFEDFIPTFPMDEEQAYALCEFMISKLPVCFQNSSYIAHLSNSMGFKPRSINLHLDFLLEFPIEPNILRAYLEYLNFTTPDFKLRIELTASKRSLHYPIDPCLAENSRIIYIGDPIIETGVVDPINCSRILLKEKEHNSVDLTFELREMDLKKARNLKRNHLTLLQEAVGFLPPKSVVRKIKLNGTTRTMNIETQPGEIEFEEHTDMGEYVTYNLNGGDSHGYYVKKDQPEIVFNFKGEEPFWFETANKEAYEQHLEKYPPVKFGGHSFKPMVFRDVISDTHYNALFNPVTSMIEEIYPAQKTNLGDFMESYNDILPAPIPSWHYTFDPTIDTVLDKREQFINKFHKPKLLADSPLIKEEYMGAEYGEHLEKMQVGLPTIYKIVYSAVGGDEECFEHLVNWLAAIVQYRKMTRTAFLLQGSYGTGKGLIYRIMHKILGRYAVEKRTENIDENFNAWLETSLFVCVDEFRAGDSTSETKLFNKIKNYITEPTGTIRGMRENQRDVPLYANWMFFTNEHDPVRLEPNDRRFNVCPRQEIPINHKYKNWDKEVEANLDTEIELFATYLKEVTIAEDKVSRILENKAREELISASQTTVDEFKSAILNSNFWYFAQTLEATPTGERGDQALSYCQNICRAWLAQMLESEDQTMHVWIENLRPFYNYLLGNTIATKKFESLLRKRGIKTVDRKMGNTFQPCITFEFNYDEVSLRRYANQYLGTDDVKSPVHDADRTTEEA